MIILYVAGGGALGAALRYLVTSKTTQLLGIAFPYGTMVVNILGSLMMGFIIGYMAKTLSHSMELRAFLTIGVLGGFTTFSAFSLDAITLMERGEIMSMAVYMVASVVLSLVALIGGLYIIRVVM